MEGQKCRILVTDDDIDMRNLLKEILCPPHQDFESNPILTPFDVTFCEQAREAVEAVRISIEEDKPFALAFMDINLPPGPDGIWAAEEIRKLDPDIGITLITGLMDIDLQKVQRRVLPADKLLYLQKPFDVREISQLALSLCTKWKAEKQLVHANRQLQKEMHEHTSALEEARRGLEDEAKRRTDEENGSRRSEEIFRNLVVTNADAIIILDSDGNVQFMNTAAESLVGKKADDLLGKNLSFPLIHYKTAELDLAFKTDSPRVMEMRVVKTTWEKRPAYLASLIDITEHKQVKKELQETVDSAKRTMRGTVQAIATAVERRDMYVAGHHKRTAEISRAIAEEMGLSEDQAEAVYMAGMIHDLGKISIPAEILAKPGALSASEMELLNSHPKVGYEMLRNIDFPLPIAEIVFQHHERMDGSGYPRGLSGEEILIESRILAVADLIEALSSFRPHRPALDVEAALGEISKNKGLLYDTRVVDAGIRLFTEKGLTLSDFD